MEKSEDYKVDLGSGYCGDGAINQVWEQCDVGGKVHLTLMENILFPVTINVSELTEKNAPI